MAQIGYGTQNTFGMMLSQVINNLIQTYLVAVRLKGVFDQIVGSPANYTNLEAALAIDTGQGQAVYNIVAGVVSVLGGNFTALSELDKG